MKDLSPLEAGRWMDAAPEEVQSAVVSESTQQVVDQLGRQHGLSVDLTDLLYKLTGYMLLGYIGPEVATQELQRAGIQEKDAREILTAVNQKIFMPLHEQMKGEVTVAPEPVKTAPAPVAAVVPARPANAPVPNYAPAPKFPEVKFEMPKRDGFYAPPPQSPSYPQVAKEESEYIFARPEETTLNTGRAAAKPTSPFGTFATQRPAPVAPKSSVNVLARNGAAPMKPIAGEKLLEDHEEPHIEFSPSPKAVPSAVKYQVPANLPGMMPPPPAIPPAPLPRPTPPAPQIRPIPIVPSAPAKLYSTDPYREPIDEESKG